MFIDRVKLKLIAGKGGNGVVTWRREKYIPKGGPTGGDGGKGGDIIIKADTQTLSLEAFRNKRLIRALDGKSGGPNRQKGGQGKELILKVPCGTLIKDIKTQEILCDLVEDGQEWFACRGGKGGRGNEGFKSPTNQAPNKCTPGISGKEIAVELELKLIADIGFVGFPNAGKSTLISSLAKVPVKIAPYPFTTLRPNLGYIEFEDFSRILIADIPGIIRGAHQDKGLGFEFLRHIERTEVLVYVIDLSGIDGRSPREDFMTLQNELLQFNPKLKEKPFLVVLNKIDDTDIEIFREDFYNNFYYSKELIFEVSALEKIGLDSLLQEVKKLAQKSGKKF